MMLRNTLACSLVLALAAASQAAVIVSSTSAPTVGLAGYTTFTLTATADAGQKIVGFDFVGDGTSKGFFGAMNQVNPFGVLATVYNDNNIAFGATDTSQDSQFKVASTKGIHLGDAEGPNKLQSAFNYNAANIGEAAQSWAFAQLAIPNAASGTVQYAGSFTVNNGQADSLVQVQGTVGGPTIPEPASIALVGLAIGLVGFTRRKK